MTIDTEIGKSDEKSGVEWVRERRDKLVEIAESDLPAADLAQRILNNLDKEEESRSETTQPTPQKEECPICSMEVIDLEQHLEGVHGAT